MAKEEYTYKPEDIELYRPIALVPEYIQQKEEGRGALEETLMKVLGNIGVKKIERKDLSSTLDLEKFIKVYSGKYQKALQSPTLGELRNLYSDLFEKFYSEENLSKVNGTFTFNSNETYGDFMKNYKAVAERAKNEADNFTKEQQEQAQKDVNELNKIAMPLQGFEELKIDSLRGPVNEESLRQRLNAPYEKEKSEEPE